MDKLTIFYSKNSGIITGFCSGEQSMDFYGVLKDDYSVIFDFIIVNNDMNVINNANNFKVNVITKQLELRQEAISQYPIAST